MALVPGSKYFRFNPTDARCEIELDATDRAQLEGLCDATDAYVDAEDARFAEACDALRPAGESDRRRSNDARADDGNDTLARAEMGSRRGMLLLEAPRLEDERNDLRSDAVAEFCLKRSIPFQRLDVARAARDAERSLAGSKRDKNPGDEAKAEKRAFGVEAVLRAASARSGQIGVVHLACRGDADGLTLRWAREMVAVAEPSAESAAFARGAAVDANGFLFRNPPPSLRALCASGPRVEVRGVLHEVLGEHTQKIASFSADDASAGGARDSAANAARRANDDAFETNEDETRGRVGARPSNVQVVAARTVVSTTEARLAAAGRRAAAEWVRANMGRRSGRRRGEACESGRAENRSGARGGGRAAGASRAWIFSKRKSAFCESAAKLAVTAAVRVFRHFHLHKHPNISKLARLQIIQIFSCFER
jgi:hypothetical protein